MRFVDSLIEFGERVADVREAVEFAAQRELEVFPGKRAALSEDISNARALVVESNPSMRSVLVAQMRTLSSSVRHQVSQRTHLAAPLSGLLDSCLTTASARLAAIGSGSRSPTWWAASRGRTTARSPVNQMMSA